MLNYLIEEILEGAEITIFKEKEDKISFLSLKDKVKTGTAMKFPTKNPPGDFIDCLKALDKHFELRKESLQGYSVNG